MYEIEKNIKILPNGCGRKRKYPFPKMEIGDSFYVSFDSFKGKSPLQAVIISAAREGKFFPRGFAITTKKLKDGVRCWRIK